jgi:hypothetical protein
MKLRTFRRIVFFRIIFLDQKLSISPNKLIYFLWSIKNFPKLLIKTFLKFLIDLNAVFLFHLSIVVPENSLGFIADFIYLRVIVFINLFFDFIVDVQPNFSHHLAIGLNQVWNYSNILWSNHAIAKLEVS